MDGNVRLPFACVTQNKKCLSLPTDFILAACDVEGNFLVIKAWEINIFGRTDS